MTKLEQTLKNIPVVSVLANPEQPRHDFDQNEIDELAASIVEHGVIKPIAVELAMSPSGVEQYILHDGERRLRASKIAGLDTIPAIVSPGLNGTGPYERLMRALVANIQSVPMNPVDDALALRRLRDEYSLTNREISKRTGKAEAWISTRLRLADLEKEILDLMRARKLSTESKVVNAFHSVPDAKQRVSLAKMLAEKHATANMIVEACSDFIELKEAARTQDDLKKKLTKAVKNNTRGSYIQMVGTPAMEKVEEIKERENEWNALFQIGKVPPYPIVNDVVMRTCDSCSLRPMANESICGGCALVSFLGDMMATVKAEAVIHA